jgi:hydrogenase maturation protease
MKCKVFAIGNILMKDDGIGIRVTKVLQERLEKNLIEVIIGETDFEYCISKIEDGDFIYIIDAAYSNKKPGDITVVSIENYRYEGRLDSQHGYSLLNLLSLYYKNIKGYIIGIEISEIDYDINLSDCLENNLNRISEKVLKKILTRKSH